MSKLPLLVVLLLAVVAISGCTGGPVSGAGGGAGVVIEAFEPDFPQIFVGEKAELRLKVKNAGGVDSKAGIASILGVDDSTVKIYGSQGTIFDSTISSSSQYCVLNNLLAADPTKGTSGEIQTCRFTFEPRTDAKIPVGITIQYTPIVRLTYGYSTSSIKSISFLASNEMRALQDSGRPLPAETVTSTSGPISILINTKGPIRTFENSVTFPIEIAVSNVGGGVVCDGGCEKADTWNRVKLEYNFKNKMDGGNACPEYVQLFRGQSNTVTCKITEPDIGTVGAIQKLYQVTATYNYFVEKSTSITVTGREGGARG